MGVKKIDYETILACKAGDTEAMQRVLDHYDNYINQVSVRESIDTTGKIQRVVDPDVKHTIQQTLLMQIYKNYDHLSGPPNEKSGK